MSMALFEPLVSVGNAKRAGGSTMSRTLIVHNGRRFEHTERCLSQGGRKQPYSPGTGVMALPKFKPGQLVEFAHPSLAIPPGIYEIVRIMPPETSEIGYRVRLAHEPHQRFAWEHELRPARKK
jgi:hypothetical protein